MDDAFPEANEKLAKAIENSEFGSVSRLTEHLGIHYNCIYQYLRLQRDPIDRWGYIKYDVLAMSEALGKPIEDLFPDGAIAGGYKLPDDDHPGESGPRAKKREVAKYFPERAITLDQAKAVIALLDLKALVRDEQCLPLAEELIRRLKPEDYDVFVRIAFEGMGADDTAGALGITPRAARSRYKNALRFLNSPATMKILKDV